MRSILEMCWSPQAISMQGDKCSDEDRQGSCKESKSTLTSPESAGGYVSEKAT